MSLWLSRGPREAWRRPSELAASAFLPLSPIITQHDLDLPREPSERTVSSGITHLHLLPR